MLRDYELKIGELPLGTHACLVYDTPEQRDKVVVPFLRQGVESGQRCLFMADPAINDEVSSALQAEGVDLSAAREAGRLVFQSERDTYRRHGNFAPGEMLTMLVDGSDRAAADGLDGLRASGEMTWPVDDVGDTTGLMEYEARVNDVIATHPVMALCLYDRTRFPDEVIVDVLRAHPVALVGTQIYRNLFYERPEAILEGVSAGERLDWMLEQLEESRQNEVRAVRLEAQLRQAQKMDAMGRLSAGVAHDFNNLLTAISGYASLLREGLDPESGHAGMVEEIMKAADRGAEMTAKLLAFGREHGRNEKPVDVARTVRGLGGILSRLIPESIAMELDIDDDLPLAWADPGGLEQVLLNLVVNARDAVEEHGRIKIAAKRGHASNDIPAVVVTVTDDGMGIPHEIRDQIFEPFFTSKPAGQGTGLGLATAYGIVRQAGGEISVDSMPGQGSTFRVALPFADTRESETVDTGPGEATATPSTDNPTAPSPGSDADTVLVIDDEAAIRSIVERVLERSGRRVIAVAGREEALVVAQNSGDQLALVISDVRLAHGDGIELLGEIRALRPDVPALMISGDTSGARIRDIPNSSLLEKPFTPDELSQRVELALASRGARA